MDFLGRVLVGELLDPNDVRILVLKKNIHWITGPTVSFSLKKRVNEQKFGKSANVDGGLPMAVFLKDKNIDTDISVILSHCLDVRF